MCSNFVHFALLIIKHLLPPESYTEIKCAFAAHSRARADASHNLPLGEVRILAFLQYRKFRWNSYTAKKHGSSAMLSSTSYSF